MADMTAKVYFQDHDSDDLIVRVWRDEKGKRHGQIWGFKNKQWFDEDILSFMVADDIYDHHPLSEKDVEEITGVKPE